MTHGEKYQESKFSHGWYVLAASFAILFFNSGARYSFGVMFKPMIAEFGWDRSSLSLAFFLNMALYAVSIAVVGKFYDRYGPKWVIVLSTLFVSAGYMLISIIDSFWQFFFLYGIVAAIGLGGPSLPLMAAVISKWFARWRGAAISVALSGGSLGQFLLIPLFTWFTFSHGWRAAYLYIGLIMLVVNTALAFFVLRGDPKEMGKKPLGDPIPETTTKDASPVRPSEMPRDLNLTEAMHTRSFWLFLITMFICGSGDFLVTTHLIPLITDHGISAVTAGNIQAWLGLMSLVGVLVAGPLSDMVGNKMPIMFTFLLRFALFLLILKYQSLVSFYVFALAFGLTFLITAPLNATLMGRLYGLSHLGLISGVISTVHHLGGGLWAFMGGWVFDRTGNYRLVFACSAGMALVAVLSTLLIAERRHHIEDSQVSKVV